jgi:hypothetical protein
LSALAPTIQADLDLDDRDYANIVNIFLMSRITSKCTTCNHFKVHHFGWVFSAGLRGWLAR